MKTSVEPFTLVSELGPKDEIPLNSPVTITFPELSTQTPLPMSESVPPARTAQDNTPAVEYFAINIS